MKRLGKGLGHGGRSPFFLECINTRLSTPIQLILNQSRIDSISDLSRFLVCLSEQILRDTISHLPTSRLVILVQIRDLSLLFFHNDLIIIETDFLTTIINVLRGLIWSQFPCA